MSVSEKRSNTVERPSSIVCIAYRQLSLMTGIEDPTESPRKEKEENAEIEKQRRFLQLPTSFMATLCTTYRNIKDTNETVTSLLNSVESGLERINPVTIKIGNVFESPLKNINDTISTGLDLLGERIPSVYEITRNYFRDVLGPIIAAMVSSFRDKIQQLSITDGVTSKDKEDSNKNTSVSK